MSYFLDLSRYSKQSYISNGSFGEVFKVKEIDTGEIFAAKISMKMISEDQKSLIINLEREISIISQLNHPAVLKFIGYSPIDFSNEYYPVIITEYSSNGSLDKIISLERQSLSHPLWDDTKKLINIYGIASAMAYLHSHNIIHRDLKPANILEDDFLFPKIADFGLSKMMHTNEESMTADSSFGLKGTYVYLPPESWDYYKYTKAGDVYAFAFIVYELLTLQIPFEGLTYGMICKKVSVNGDRPEFKYPIPDCYRSLITRCWAQDPQKRPSFEQIVEELKSNGEFITGCVDKDEFLSYMEMIDSLGSSFDPHKKFKKFSIFNATEIDSNNSKSTEINSNNSKLTEIDSYNSKLTEINSNNSKLTEIDSNNSKLTEIDSNNSKLTEIDSNNSKLTEINSNQAEISSNNSKKKIVNSKCNLKKVTFSAETEFKELKVAVFGAGGVGKSSLVIQFVPDYFAADYDPTEDFYKVATSVDEQFVLLKIMDTAGQDDFAPMRTSYMRQGKAFILVYSVDNRASFNEIQVFHQDLCRVKGTNDILVVICGNNCDSNQRTVSQEEGEKLAQKLNAGFVESSSENNINVDKVFETLIYMFLEKEKADLSKEEKADLSKKEKKKRFSLFKRKNHH